MDRRNRPIFTAAAVLVSISVSGCEDTVTLTPDFAGGWFRTTTDGITGEGKTEHVLPPPPAPTGALKSDAGRG